jgi:hypothetical protein
LLLLLPIYYHGHRRSRLLLLLLLLLLPTVAAVGASKSCQPRKAHTLGHAGCLLSFPGSIRGGSGKGAF